MIPVHERVAILDKRLASLRAKIRHGARGGQIWNALLAAEQALADAEQELRKQQIKI